MRVAQIVAVAARRPVRLDIVNEVEGAITHDFFRGGWNGAAKFVKTTAAFVHARASVAVTASYGWGSWDRDLLAGELDGIGLDFIDFHPYTDVDRVPRGDEVARHAADLGLPVVIGEFGQSRGGAQPALQAKIVRGMLHDAQRLGFAAVLAWRLEDEGPQFTFYDGDVPRPAIDEVLAFANGW